MCQGLSRSGFFSGQVPSPGQGPSLIRVFPGQGPSPFRVLPRSGSFPGQGPPQIKANLNSTNPWKNELRTRSSRLVCQGLPRSGFFFVQDPSAGHGPSPVKVLPRQGPSPVRVFPRSGSAPGQGEPKFYQPVTKCSPNSILKPCVSRPSLVRVLRK